MEGNGFAKLVYGTLEGNGIDTKDMPFDDAVKKFNELGGESNWKAKIMKKESEENNSKQITYDNIFNNSESPRVKKAKDIITELDGIYENDTKSVKKQNVLQMKGAGGHFANGILTLGALGSEYVAHEFAHSITRVDSSTITPKEKEFWKELENINKEYKKAVEQDISNSISTYADAGEIGKGKRNLNEFMAEAFSMVYNNRKGEKTKFEVNQNNLKWGEKVVGLIDKYFKK